MRGFNYSYDSVTDSYYPDAISATKTEVAETVQRVNPAKGLRANIEAFARLDVLAMHLMHGMDPYEN